MSKFFKQKNTAFTLVETLVAISIFTVSLLGIMSVLASGIANTNYAKQKMVATYLAQEGIEYIRNMRDTKVLYGSGDSNAKWNQFKSDLSPCNNDSDHACGFNTVFPYDVSTCPSLNDCKLYVNNGGYNTNSSGTDSGFVRKIWMDTAGLGSDEVKIFSKVEWTTGSGVKSVTFSENLFNWW
ncbi:type II secretion system protein [Candidatus Nomurabacteria bacterium]|nr:type II secretion system protein [Candidatus Nomurabacteria bacterium]